jgi:hypothetical protein
MAGERFLLLGRTLAVRGQEIKHLFDYEMSVDGSLTSNVSSGRMRAMIEQTFSTTVPATGIGHHAAGVVRPRRKERPRRLRLATVVILMLAAFLLLVAPGLIRERGFDRGASRVAYQQPVSYTVQSGDTLWSIARRIDPAHDPRPLVDALIAYNDLHGDLQVGQAIYLPAPPR